MKLALQYYLMVDPIPFKNIIKDLFLQT